MKDLFLQNLTKSILNKIIFVFILFNFYSCSGKIITSNIKNSNFPMYKPVSVNYDPVNDINKIEIDNIELLFKFADLNFLSEKFSYIIEDKKVYKNEKVHCIPFYMLQKNTGEDTTVKSPREKYTYFTGLTPFYISIKNKNDHKIYIDLEKNSAIVDENGRQYNPYNYAELEKNNLIYTYKKKKQD